MAQTNLTSFVNVDPLLKQFSSIGKEIENSLNSKKKELDDLSQKLLQDRMN